MLLGFEDLNDHLPPNDLYILLYACAFFSLAVREPYSLISFGLCGRLFERLGNVYSN